jgi:hypothetical protein
MGGGAAHSASAGAGDYDSPAPSHSMDDQAGPDVSDEDIPF